MKGFGGMGGMGNMQNLLKQAKQMQEQLAVAQQQVQDLIVEGTSGNGMVTVTLDGKKVLKSIKLDKKIIDPDDVELLEDLIVAAFNDAAEQATEKEAEIMGPFASMGGGLL